MYRIHYPAPGAPELAEDILKRLADAHLTAHANSTRTRDHGVWMPLLHMYPEADIPVIEISLPMQLNSDEIYAVGQALAPLREQQILLIGSGSITHNLAELRWQGNLQNIPEWASGFRNHVVNKLTHQDYDAILNWPDLPHIERNHPTIEHFAPLFLPWVQGIASLSFTVVFDGIFRDGHLPFRLITYRFELNLSKN